ncbi:hypothetical protein DERF_010706 [Dermatophagoides farinae]|uniref:Sugar phosphate phosphatase n=1 Tax=Dermatophagoides farinae TaxID=6954 RepID=A0A922KZC8_DERFA|nr:hypothetical protein DERF_010706 [Dermatophagoides farinae]
MDSQPIIPEPLSANDKNSFAYKTLSYRLPIIITKVIDLLCRQRKQIISIDLKLPPEQQPEAEEETKQLIEELAKLKYELQTNKSIRPIVSSSLSDTQAWNDLLNEEYRHNDNVVYFNVSWLLSECYFYRMMHEIFIRSKYFQNFDQFFTVKKESFELCLKPAEKLAKHLLMLNDQQQSSDYQESTFTFYTMHSLWGNKFDLSLSCGERKQTGDFDFNELESKILVNDLKNFWSFMQQLLSGQNSNNNQNDKKSYRIDIILDNAGYELFTDFCWVEAMHTIGLLPKDQVIVHFHVKCMPWFVSDTMTSDIKWLLKYVNDTAGISLDLKRLNERFNENFRHRQWLIEEHDFWTLPHDYAQMPRVAPELYRDFCHESRLILFKGDLNYRKLVGDRKWNIRTSFKQAIREFQPKSAAICTLRTIKADVVVGIHDDPVIIERIKQFPSDWMEIGEYAVINFLKID